ncbi:MAG: hypothetical protein V3U31_00060 [Dehalococcoidia bacterium]
MLEPQARQRLTELGLSEEEMSRVGDRVKRVLGQASTMRQYQIVAEVTQARYCNAELKVGQKIVFSCMPFKLDTAQTDCPLCLRALAPVLDPVTTLRELMLAGVDPAGPDMTRGAGCLDPGLEQGGLGHVRFKVYLNKAS